MLNNKRNIDTLRKGAIIFFWLLVWQLLALAVNNSILLVGPVHVVAAFAANIIELTFFETIFFSLTRIGIGFGTALVAGLLCGALATRHRFVKELLAPVLVTIKSIPVASFVVLLLIWFGSDKISLFISFLIVFPNVYINTMAGMESVDEGLLEMAKVFRVTGHDKRFYLYRTALIPYLFSCLEISLGMAWKSGVAAEIIGMTSKSLGERLYMSKISLDTAELFAWTLTVILVSFLFERMVLYFLKKYQNRKPYPKVRAKKETEKRREVGKKEFTGQKTGEPAYTEKAVGVSVQNVYKNYGSQNIFTNLSVEFVTGKRYVLMGSSGRGKTTLLRIVAGLEAADTGKVAFVPNAQCADDVPLKKGDSCSTVHSKAFAKIGMVFQENRLCEEYDTIANVMLTTKCIPIETIEQEAKKLLPEDALHKPVKELSGGMQRRVALLRAVLADNELLLFDEPFTGLDEKTKEKCAAYLLENLNGRTLVVATHNEEDADTLSAEIVRL